MIVGFEDQSSAADWNENAQFLSELDGQPLWSTVPIDLTLSLSVFPEYEDRAVISDVYPGGAGMIEPFADGFFEINVPATSMANLAPDNRQMSKRHKVFVKAVTGGVTLQMLVGVLPVYWGA